MTDLWERLRSRLATSSIAEADPDILDQLDSIVAPSQIRDVAEWMRVRGLIQSDDPVDFRTQLGFVDDELTELDDAIQSGDCAHIAKEMVDSIWTLCGLLVVHCGGDVDMAQAVWAQLVRSNASKPSERDANGKIPKGPDFVEADVAGVLEGKR